VELSNGGNDTKGELVLGGFQDNLRQALFNDCYFPDLDYFDWITWREVTELFAVDDERASENSNSSKKKPTKKASSKDKRPTSKQSTEDDGDDVVKKRKKSTAKKTISKSKEENLRSPHKKKKKKPKKKTGSNLNDHGSSRKSSGKVSSRLQSSLISQRESEVNNTSASNNEGFMAQLIARLCPSRSIRGAVEAKAKTNGRSRR
jgi:hypothetical protein